MDPRANIERQLELAQRILRMNDLPSPGEYAQPMAEDGAELAELVVALDEWRAKGGFDPYGRVLK